jgi:Domain of unknown function (DUF4260)
LAEVNMKTMVRFEELGLFLFSLYLYSSLPFPWWYLPLLLFAPDLSMAGYAAGPRLGSVIYNILHHRALALLLYVVGLLGALPILSLAGIILFAHSSLDRALGYGLKFPDAFANTHLGRIGRAAPRS